MMKEFVENRFCERLGGDRPADPRRAVVHSHRMGAAAVRSKPLVHRSPIFDAMWPRCVQYQNTRGTDTDRG